MLPFAINHMTCPRLRWDELLTLAVGLGCVGVEFRNDLETPLFSGEAPETVGARARDLGLRIIGLSEVYSFNFWDDAIAAKVAALIVTAQGCGAETISLIPRNDGTGLGNGERQANLRLALREIKPMLEAAGLTALVEPLGFQRSSLRSKAETIEAIHALGGDRVFRLVHDTFHHTLAGGGEVFPGRTGLVHVSGVEDPTPAVSEMEDSHRGLVTPRDRLSNIDQLAELCAGGYLGPISVEAFSPDTHALADPVAALRETFDFIRTSLGAKAA
ncbi:TIM barrel protein [Roseisalinus antarcticus]|uniref:Xylose isomerase-like TIM barrel n=1 Tax=Roseisalinus antarcticus TaxID=254357 RepID=A0A1Y5RZU0_9RHOB|nr:TIM barrel protein [Roseisalinus antarcticus]SLN29089.1 Xylose isomerase-like TIM barrel [Roseisalinus antarcticus]